MCTEGVSQTLLIHLTLKNKSHTHLLRSLSGYHGIGAFKNNCCFDSACQLPFNFCIRILFMRPGFTRPFDSFMTCLQEHQAVKRNNTDLGTAMYAAERQSGIHVRNTEFGKKSRQLDMICLLRHTAWCQWGPLELSAATWEDVLLAKLPSQATIYYNVGAPNLH